MAKRRLPWGLRCGAKRTNGLPCKKWAYYGCTRCYLHGGKSPRALAKAPERIELVARAAVQPAIDTITECLSSGPRHKRLHLALAVLENAGILDEETEAIVNPMVEYNPVAEGKNDFEE